MRHRTHLRWWSIALAVLMASSTGIAAPVPPSDGPDAPSRTPARSAGEEADELFARGEKAYSAGKLEEAVLLLTMAWERKRTYDIAGNLGIVELKLGRVRDAAEHLAFALRNFPPTEEERVRAGLKAKLAEARARVGAVIVRVNVPQAEIVIDDRMIDPSTAVDGELFVGAGTVTIEARKEGYVTARRTVTIERGAPAIEVSLTLERSAVAPPVKQRPPVVERPGDEEATEKSIVPAVALGGAAVIGAAVGVGLLAAAGGKGSTAETLNASIRNAGGTCVTGGAHFSARCAELEDATRSADTLHNAGVGALIGAGLAAVGAGAYLLLWPAPAVPQKAGIHVRVAPAVDARERGVVVVGSF